LLHHLEAHLADAEYHNAHYLHDLPGDSDLEIPGEGEEDEYEEVLSYVAPRSNLFGAREKNAFAPYTHCEDNADCDSKNCQLNRCIPQ